MRTKSPGHNQRCLIQVLAEAEANGEALDLTTLQRRLNDIIRLGHQHASRGYVCRMLDQLEHRGYVSPSDETWRLTQFGWDQLMTAWWRPFHARYWNPT